MTIEGEGNQFMTMIVKQAGLWIAGAVLLGGCSNSQDASLIAKTDRIGSDSSCTEGATRIVFDPPLSMEDADEVHYEVIVEPEFDSETPYFDVPFSCAATLDGGEQSTVACDEERLAMGGTGSDGDGPFLRFTGFRDSEHKWHDTDLAAVFWRAPPAEKARLTVRRDGAFVFSRTVPFGLTTCDGGDSAEDTEVREARVAVDAGT